MLLINAVIGLLCRVRDLTILYLIVLFVLYVTQTSTTYAKLELSGGSGASIGSPGKGKGTVKQDDVRVNYGEIDHSKINAASKSHPPAKPPHKDRGGTT